MALPDIFSKDVATTIVGRIQQLTPATQAQWGKMNVGQMLAHCCVSYEYVYEEAKFKKPGGFMKLILKLMVKPIVVNEKPYKQSSATAPDFIITNERDFAMEQNRLISFIYKVQAEGRSKFEGRASHSFGVLTATEWNNMFYKHLDHHLRQFGV